LQIRPKLIVPFKKLFKTAAQECSRHQAPAGAKSPAPPPKRGADPMGRYEMAGAEMAPLAGTKPNTETFFELGILYATGREVAPDLIAAHKWFNLAAIGGNPEAALHRQQIAAEMSVREI